MKYDFTSIMDRHGKDSIAVDGLGKNPGFTPDVPKEGFDVIPMWVADMNFPTVPTITEAITERAKHAAFGYFHPTDAYFDSIIRWQENRNGVTGLTADCIGYENGVWGALCPHYPLSHHPEIQSFCTVLPILVSPTVLETVVIKSFTVH